MAPLIRKTSCVLQGWKIVQHKTRGRGHEKTGAPCQDFTEASVVGPLHQTFENPSEKNPDTSLILLQADGAGSARYSDAGAESACNCMTLQLQHRKYSEDMLDTVQMYLQAEAAYVNEKTQEKTQETHQENTSDASASYIRPATTKDFASTLAGVHILEDDPQTSTTKFTVFQLGDSVMCVWLNKDSSYFKNVFLNLSFLECLPRYDWNPSLLEYFKNFEGSWTDYTDVDRSFDEVTKKVIEEVDEDGGTRREDATVLVMHPENGEHANETWMTTSKDAKEHIRSITCNLDGVEGFALMSDGTAESLYDKKRKQMAPAMLKLFKMISRESLEDGQQQLDEIFKNVVSKKTMDDCSILIAVRDKGEN